MTPHSRVIRLWILLGLLMGVILFILGRPLAGAWRCYARAANGERADAKVVDKHETLGLILEILSGSQAGQVCTVKTSRTIYEKTQPGDVLSIVAQIDQPGQCVLGSTLTASMTLLWILSGAIVLILLFIVVVGWFIHRSYTQQPKPTSHLDLCGQSITCPRCDSDMTEGYLPLLAGLHWRSLGEPVGMPHVFAGLPGTIGWRGRPRLHAYHCETCQVITLKYGRC